MRLFFLLFTMLFSFFSYPEGFSGKAKVLTNNGYVAIESIRSGDSIICFDAKRLFVEGVVSSVSNCLEKLVIILSIREEKVISVKGQKFFSSSSMNWIDAENIVVGDNLLTLDGNDVRVDSVKTVNEQRKLHKISVDTHNNFFVTYKNLLVHNYGWLIDKAPDALVFIAENCETIKNTVEAATSLVFELAENSQYRKVSKQNGSDHRDGGGGYGFVQPPEKKPPEKKPDDDKDYSRIHEKVRYHGSRDSGRKSRAPINGQSSLDRSVEIPTDSRNSHPRRISTGEERRMDIHHETRTDHNTKTKYYHSHSRPWKDVPEEGKKALKAAKMVNKKGKPILPK